MDWIHRYGQVAAIKHAPKVAEAVEEISDSKKTELFVEKAVSLWNSCHGLQAKSGRFASPLPTIPLLTNNHQ